MNRDTIQGKWKEIKGDLRKTWGKITDDEWEQTKGDVTSMAGILQQRYGFAKDDAASKINSVIDRYDTDRPTTRDVESDPRH
jgi:uncharacterized protein YjbJ (UPF0337 family)